MEEEAFKVLSEIPYGKIILAVVALIIIALAILEKTTNLFSGAKERAEQRRKTALEKAMADQKFRENINTIVQEVPKMNGRMSSVNSQINSFLTRESSLEETQQMCINMISDLKKDITNLKDLSDKKDELLTQQLQETTKTMAELSASLNDISEKVNLIIESDTDEFRIYLMNIYNEYARGNKKIPLQLKQVLRTRFKRSKAEGGNGWAQSLMDEIMKLDTEYDIQNQDIE